MSVWRASGPRSGSSWRGPSGAGSGLGRTGTADPGTSRLETGKAEVIDNGIIAMIGILHVS